MVTNSFGNRNFMQPMGRPSMHSKCLDLFLLSWGVGGWAVEGGWRGGGGVFSFCSQPVPFKFPMGFQYIPWVPNMFPKGVPNITAL